jgi:uncharacterized membrane protein YbhN (UPF0104 family)
MPSDPSEDAEAAAGNSAAAAANPATTAPPVKRPRAVGRRALSGLFSIAIIVLTLALIPQLTSADLGTAAALITVGAVIVTQLLGLVHLVANWWVTTITLPGLSMPQAGVVGLSGAVVSNTFPSGGAVATGLTYAIDHSWGFPMDAITASIVTNGLFGQLVRYGVLAVALVVFAVVEQPSWQLILFAVIVAALVAGAVVILVLVLRNEHFAGRFGRLATRIINWPLRLAHRRAVDAVPAVMSFRVKLSGLVAGRWRRLTGATLVSQLTSVLILGVALRMMDVPQHEVGWAQIIVAIEGAAIAATFIPTPGGLGVTEAALMAILSYGVPASQDNAILAAIILYRAATWLQSTVLGLPAYLTWRYRRSWRQPEPHPERPDQAGTLDL